MASHPIHLPWISPCCGYHNYIRFGSTAFLLKQLWTKVFKQINICLNITKYLHYFTWKIINLTNTTVACHSILQYHNIAINIKFCQYFIDLQLLLHLNNIKITWSHISVSKAKIYRLFDDFFQGMHQFWYGVGGGNS